MNTDFRVKVNLFSHPKFVKLCRVLGDGGGLALLRLWGFVTQNRPNGKLSKMDGEDIAIAANWTGDTAQFIDALVNTGWLEETAEGFEVRGIGVFFTPVPPYIPSDICDSLRAKARSQSATIFSRDSGRCVYCGSDANLTIDHAIPLSRGGDNSFGNLITACRACNSSKGSKTPEEWRRN